MIQKMYKPNTNIGADRHQSGQSMVIIALALIGLLAFVGIAVDVGFIFQRSSKLQSAVDSAALAGVTDLPSGLDAADQKAGQFLNANSIPISVTQSLQSTTQKTLIGEDRYSITVTWPIDLFFLKLVGLNDYVLTRSATAAHFPQADIYASRRVDQGLVNTSNQSIFGPYVCTAWGDPFTPNNTVYTNERPYSYKYRILIPADYPDDVLRVEIYDPDSYNAPGNTANVIHSQTAVLTNESTFPPGEIQMNCQGSQADRTNACNINTGEDVLVGSNGVAWDNINPFWMVRVDENRGLGTSGSSGICDNAPGYAPNTNTPTLFAMFYYRENDDGTIEQVDLARYTGLIDNAHDTDLRWVSPGGAVSFDQPNSVPVDSNTPINPATGNPYTFELNIERDLPNILTEVGSGNRYVYLNVTGLPPGGSENGFEIWAGPDEYTDSTPSNVNERNLHIIRQPDAHYSYGATVFGMGNLPMNSNTSNRVDIPLMYVGPEMAGSTIFIRIFDPDSGAEPPVIFFFDSIAYTPDGSDDGVDWARTDWAMSYGGTNDPDFGCFRVGSGCQDEWVSYQITVPGGDDNDCYQHPTRGEQCIPFYGGRLTADYQGGTGDTYGWEIQVAGDPYLVK
jgi:hypothetical protein